MLALRGPRERARQRAGQSAAGHDQIYYSLQAREAEYELVPIGLDEEVGILVWSPLAAGLLTGAYRRGQAAPEDGRHLASWDEPPVHDEEALYDIIEALVAIGEDHGVSAAQVSLAWSMNRPGVASLVIGARTDAQLLDT
jgi:aryl-alcohol dehydrogenase-like predicted oxidoreductase